MARPAGFRDDFLVELLAVVVLVPLVGDDVVEERRAGEKIVPLID
jgi:hypothetical protein